MMVMVKVWAGRSAKMLTSPRLCFVQSNPALRMSSPRGMVSTSFPWKERTAFNESSIAGYEFPSYAKTVRVYLHNPMIGRLLLTEEGYSHYSHAKALTLTNKYTVRLYWLVCSWRNRGGFVISLDNLRKILQLSPSYERYCNVTARVLNPSMEELHSRFPIWFQYRLYKRNEGPVLAFKIKVKLAPEEENRIRKDAYEFCFRLLTKSGIGFHAFSAIFDSVETEDIKPFVNKLTDVVTYISEHPEIRSRDRYLRTALDAWFSDWSVRYPDIGE